MNAKVPSSTYAVARLRLLRDASGIRNLLSGVRWREEEVASGERCLVGDLSRYRGCRGWWAYVAESAMLEAHRHGRGGEYGERVYVVVGEVDDVDGQNQLVRLKAGQWLDHAPGSIHQPNIPRFAVFVVHRPNGLAPLLPT